MTIKIKSIRYFLLLLYFIAITTYQLGVGFDAIFVRVTFILFVLSSIFDRSIKFTNYTKWLVLFWSLYFVSLLWAYNKSDVMLYFNHALQILLFSISIESLVNSEEGIKKVLNILVFSILYSTIVLIIRTPSSAWGTERVGDVINVWCNNLSMRLSTAAIIIVYFLDTLKNNDIHIKKIILCILLVLFAGVSLFTGSKKGLVLLIVGPAIYYFSSTKGFKTIKKTFLLSCVVGIIIFFVFNNKNLYNILGRRLEITYYTLIGSSLNGRQDNSYLERKFYINEGIELFKQKPILGHGGNNFYSYMKLIEYRHAAYSHNNYIELLSTLGIIGFIIYYSFICYILFSLYNNYKKCNNKLILIMLIFVFLQLLMDYGMVSFADEFVCIIICLCYYTNRNSKGLINIQSQGVDYAENSEIC